MAYPGLSPAHGWDPGVAMRTTLLLLTAALSASAAPTVYVAVNGNDAWSGTLPAPNAAKTDGPVATLGRAQAVARQLKAETVALRAGVYYLIEPLVLSADDSGVTWTAYQNEQVELVGGRRLTGLKDTGNGILAVDLPQAKGGAWQFRSLYVDGQRQIRARCPNFDPDNPYRGGFFYAIADRNGFGFAVGNIHNPGDWMDYDLSVPADGEYRVWLMYGALNKPFGNDDMAGRTALVLDGGDPVVLDHLPDTGGWGDMKWSPEPSATVTLTKGEHQLRWINNKGGGLNLSAFCFSDDEAFQPEGTDLQVGAGKHLLVQQAAQFKSFNGKQLSVGGGGPSSKNAFCYEAGTFQPEWVKQPGVEVHIFQSGSCRAYLEMVTPTAVDETKHEVTVAGPECTAPLKVGDRYFVENLRSELDAPGEWYLDTNAGRLYYQPQVGYQPTSEVVAPVLGRMIELNGTQNVKLVGLTFRGTDYALGDGCTGYGMGSDGTVFLGNANGCAIEHCRFDGIGKYAVCLNGGEQNVIKTNDIRHAGEGGILLLGSARNRVEDNLIQHCGECYKHNGGIVLQNAGADENVIAHNEISDQSRYGISIKNGGFRNQIVYNRVARTNLETYDTGGIEVTQGNRTQRSGSTIAHNLVADTVGYSCSGENPVYLSWSIYLDSFAGGYDVHHNVCYRNNNGGIMFQGGKGNHVHNNIFVDGERFQGYLSNFLSGFEDELLERNIFAWQSDQATLFGSGKISPEVIRIDHNLYFPPGGGEPATGHGGRMTWAEWQQAGFDVNSVCADPKFVDPANDDYRLQPDSPAFKLGFEAIEVSEIGLLTKR